ncbi:Gnb1l [Symbiodinium natans]|uniref:Gnb1l protein n=1 Tax=Symbiodinium natans TaxID=878477 RepID=A0A812MD85_9DINO|nr:Gnb1l [Symbiodinium natans]
MEPRPHLAPSVIIRSRAGGVYSLSFISAGKLLSGSLKGEVSLWDLHDQRPDATWKVSDETVLSLLALAKGQQCLSQGKDGRVGLWDVETQKASWEVGTGSCAFARLAVMPSSGGDPWESQASDVLFCSPLAEPHEIGVFDCRKATAPQQCSQLVLSAPIPCPGSTSPLSTGMCMDLSAAPALGPHALLATYESTACCLWDLRSPSEPLSSCYAGDPRSPAICSAMLWRKAWVACADGHISQVKLRLEGLEATRSSVRAAPAPYRQSTGQPVYKEDKQGVNAFAVRPDLRLVAAARWDRRVELFDAKTATSLGRLACHDGSVLCVTFDRQRGALAAGGEDGRIAAWGLFSETYTGPWSSDPEAAKFCGVLP